MDPDVCDKILGIAERIISRVLTSGQNVIIYSPGGALSLILRHGNVRAWPITGFRQDEIFPTLYWVRVCYKLNKPQNGIDLVTRIYSVDTSLTAIENILYQS